MPARTKTKVQIPYRCERDEDGIWCAHAWLCSSGGANGNGASQEEAVASLRQAALMVLDEDGVPEHLRYCLELEIS
jgi:hypothetical protein